MQKRQDPTPLHDKHLQRSLAFLYTNNKQIKKEYMETIPFTIASKKSNT
jgi:hypothetical protein